jgi:hypothetical protein
MKHLSITITALVALTGLFSSCRKGINEKLDDNNNPVSGYMSTKAGSWWLYGATDGTITHRVATGVDSVKLDRVYNYYETTDTVSKHITPEYFGKNAGMFLMLVDLDGNQTNYMNVAVQKDNAQVGDTWSNTGDITYSGMKFDLLAEGEVMSVNTTMTINGHTYTDVAEIRNKLKAKPVLSPFYTNCGTATMWFKKGIGIIKADYDISISSFFSKQYTDSLLDYHIQE